MVWIRGGRMKKLKLGIIGFGFMGQWHNNHAGTMDEVEILAVCDSNPSQLEKVPEGIRCYSDYKELLLDKDVEWVMICVPNHLHKVIAIDAAYAKKNIIVEKPCTLTVAEFDQMYEAARQNGVIFTVDQNRRWDRDYSMAKIVVNDLRLGKLYRVKSSLSGVFGKMHDWHQDKKFGGGMLYDWGVHLIDQMLDLIPGKITQIYADMKSVVNEEVDDYFKIILHYEGGLAAEIELGTFLLYKMPRWYISGDKGTMVVENIKADAGAVYYAGEVSQALPETVKNLDAGPTRTFSTKSEDVVHTMDLPEVNRIHNDWNDFFRNIVAFINEEEELIVTPAQVRRVLQVMEAVRSSAESGKSVDFE
jgi:Predicted dehydrogenases and related proteins